MNRTLILCLSLVMTLAAAALAQRGDRGNQEQPEVWKQMDVPPAPPLSPEEAIKSFRIMPGFRIELVAAEPLVEDPVAMDFDAAGRLYVVEMRGYMPNVDGTGEEAPIGRVVRLEDTDGDGRMDKSVVFLDELVMPRAVAVLGDGGVLVGEPPHLWLCRDTDGDGVSDEKTELYNHYGSQGPVEHTDNGLTHAIDNWVYNAKSDKRFKVSDGKLLVDKTRFRGQWGIAQDNYGRLYHNSNSDYLRVDLLPSDLLDANPYYETDNGLSVGVVRDQSTHSIRVNPGVNRGYQKNTLREDGRLRRTTAVSGVAIYRGDQFGDDYVGDAFVPEPSANLVACFDIEDGGLTMKSKQRTTPDEKWGERAFLASTDERFRPVSAYNGPDGAMYIVDLYRGILQHKVYVTSFLRKQILERGLDKSVHMGRIWRIVKDDRPIDRKTADLSKMTSAELAAKLGDANGWTRDMAQRLLVSRRDEKAIEPLVKMVGDDAAPLGQLHAMWTLAGMDAINKSAAYAGMNAKDANVRLATLRTAVPVALHGKAELNLFIQSDGPVYAAMSDRDEAVRLGAMRAMAMVVSTPPASRASMLDDVAAAVSGELDDAKFRDVPLSGMTGLETRVAAIIAGLDDGKVDPKGRAALLTELARIVMRRGDAAEIAGLIETAVTAKDTAARIALLTGMTSWGKKTKKLHLDERPAGLDAMVKSDDKTVAELAKALDTEWLAYGADAGDQGPRKLTDAEQKLYDVGKERYALICAACHQPHGKGQAGLAPPLVDSEWVTGDPQIAARIVLHGLMGPVEVNGQEWELVMPGNVFNPLFDDESIAGVLTYIRREWDNGAEPVTAELVKGVRAATKDRVEPWTVEQLKGGK